MAVVAKTAVAALLCGELAAAANQGYKDSSKWLPRAPVPGAFSADELIAEEHLPTEFDYRNVNGKNYVVADWNQHIPIYCGSCWIHGTTSALNDRIKVMRGAKFPDIVLSRQMIMDCTPGANTSDPPPGCDGGDSWMMQRIHQYLTEQKVPDETCMPYQARNMKCDASHNCRNCLPAAAAASGPSYQDENACFPVKDYTGYGVKTYGNVSGEVAMMKEIYARGPIACSWAADDRFMFHYSEVALQNEGVYVSNTTHTPDQVDHVMEVTGWGSTPSGLKYWVVRNSWGTYWGDAGWALIKRGVNDMQGEASCDWAVPTYGELDEALERRVLGDYVLGIRPVGMIERGEAVSLAATRGDVATAVSEVQTPTVGLVAIGATFGAVVGAFVATRVSARGVRQSPLLG